MMAARTVAREPQLPLFDLRIEQEDMDSVAAALGAGTLTSGALVGEFEAAFQALLGAHHAVAVSSGTAALHLAYLAAAVGPGDEVIVPAITFVATASAAVYCGAKPVIADILGAEDLSLDPAAVQAALTPRTRAVCAVHYGGYGAPVDRLAALCAERGIALIEDAAHAPGAVLAGRALGTWGTASAFSFFSNKVLSVGEGGLVALADSEAANQARRLRAADDPANSGDLGEPRLDYELDEPRAALLLSRMRRLGQEIERRRALTMLYRSRLQHVDGVLVPYTDQQVATSSCYVMPVLVDDPGRRDGVRARMLAERGVQTSVLYPALHELSAYRELAGVRSRPEAERVARTQITLPLYPHMTEADVERVVEALEDALR